MTHTACPFQARCPTCPVLWAHFLQLELRYKHLPVRKGLIFEPYLWVGVQLPCDFFEYNGLCFKKLNIPGSLTKVVYNKTTIHYTQQPRLLSLLLFSLSTKVLWNPFLVKDIQHSLILAIYLSNSWQKLWPATQKLFLRTETSKDKQVSFPSFTSEVVFSFHALSQISGIILLSG